MKKRKNICLNCTLAFTTEIALYSHHCNVQDVQLTYTIPRNIEISKDPDEIDIISRFIISADYETDVIDSNHRAVQFQFR